MVYANAQLLFLCILQHKWSNGKQYAVPASANSKTSEGGDNISCHPKGRRGECPMQRKSFYHHSQDLCGQRNQNIFRKLMLDSSFSIVLAFEDKFSYHNVLIYYFFLRFRMAM